MSSRRPSVFERLGSGGGSYPERVPPMPSDVCRNYLQGTCQFGSKCRYVHPGKAVLEELLLRGDPRDLRESSSLGLSSRGSERRERHLLSSHGYQQHPPLHPALAPPLLPLQDHSEHHHRHHSHGHHHGHSRKHRRQHSGHELSPPPEPEKRHRRHKKSRHRSPKSDDVEFKLLKSKKQLRSPEEGVVSGDVSELEEGQMIDGDDLERRRMQLQRQLELLQGREDCSGGAANVGGGGAHGSGRRRRDSSSSSSSSSGSSSPGEGQSGGHREREPRQRKRERRRQPRRKSPHGGSPVALPDNGLSPQELLLHRGHRRPAPSGAVGGIHGARGARSPSPPFSHSPHGMSTGPSYRGPRGPHHHEHDPRSRSRPGPAVPYPTGPPPLGFRSPSPPPGMPVHANSSRAPLGRHAMGPPGGVGGSFGRRPPHSHLGQQQQHGYFIGGGDGFVGRLGSFRSASPDLHHRNLGAPPSGQRMASLVVAKGCVAISPRMERDETDEQAADVDGPASRRTRTSTEETAKQENGESSSDDSISSVLVEEAQMGEDDADDDDAVDQTADVATAAATISKETEEELSGGAAESTSKCGLSAEEKDDTNDTGTGKSPATRPADETRPVSPSDGSHNSEIDSAENKEQFSDWSSEEDGFLAKEVDGESNTILLSGENKVSDNGLSCNNDKIANNDGNNNNDNSNIDDDNEDIDKTKVRNEKDSIVNNNSNGLDNLSCGSNSQFLLEGNDELQAISSGVSNRSSSPEDTTDESKQDAPNGSLTGLAVSTDGREKPDALAANRLGSEAAAMGAERGLLEEAEAISDDDLEALIEEDNEPMVESSEEGDAAKQRRKQFRPAPIYDALGIDWESLVKKTPNHAIGYGDQRGHVGLDKANGVKGSSSEARAQWRAHAVLLRIGLSYDLCGRALTEQVERALPPGATMHSTVAGLHVAMSREAAQLRDAIERAGGPYARAFSARRDLMLRKRLAAVKESAPEERSAGFEHAVQIFHQTIAAKQ